MVAPPTWELQQELQALRERLATLERELADRRSAGEKVPGDSLANAPSSAGAPRGPATPSCQRVGEELRGRVGPQAEVGAFGLRALAEVDLTKLLDEAATVVSQALGVEYAGILDLLPDGSAFGLRAGVGWKEGCVGRATVRADLDSLAGYTYLSGKPVIVEDLALEARFRPPALLREHGVNSAISVLIQGQGRMYGVLYALTCHRRAFSGNEASLLQTIANLLAAAIHRHQAEGDLCESQNRLRLALEAARMGTWEWNIATNKVTWCPRLHAIHGLPDGTFGGTYEAFLERVHPDDRAAVAQTVTNTLRMHTEHNVEYRLVCPDGSTRWLEGRGQLICDESGQPLRMLGVCMEVTQRKQAEEQVRLHQAELARVARLSTLGVMTSAVAHELNQPLTAINAFAHGCVERLRAGPVNAPEMLAAVEKISYLAARAGKVIARLRNLVRRRPPHRSTVDLNELVREVVALVALETRRGHVRVHLELAEALPVVLVDRIQIEQVILNLALNATEAMSQVPAGERELTLQTSWLPGNLVEVSVRDRGCGIAPEISPQIFDPFFTTKTDGMGMGLAISRSMIEGHGGRLWVIPNPDRGVTFHFTLPVHKED